MTDNEIIKALECCITNDCSKCKAYDETYGEIDDCLHTICRNALKLINRQKELIEKSERVEHFADKTIATLQAEIKKLNGQVEHLIDYVKTLKAEKDNLIRTYAECQAEAVKEFAEILKGDAVGWIEITVDDIEEAKRKVLNRSD